MLNPRFNWKTLKQLYASTIARAYIHTNSIYRHTVHCQSLNAKEFVILERVSRAKLFISIAVEFTTRRACIRRILGVYQVAISRVCIYTNGHVFVYMYEFSIIIRFDEKLCEE